VIAHSGEPLERVERLAISPEEGIHLRAVEHRLLTVQVDELLERERVADQIGGGVFQALPVLGGRSGRPRARRSRDGAR
jgi:hypothetical protein